ncbi:hypothetical protein HPB52_019402 [Rhipicephalus sanguineus]|uniref:Uncharacterized protein n=1 Tax=Rhipicephalus sanguineus TaxID=34632 RepID=A0A9D4YQM9_RHISA|nr:hypothetical protein HPB52_019402 [Rhipicephalus sanguineus]
MRPGIHGTPATATGNNHSHCRSNRTCETNWGRHDHHRYYCYDNNGNSASGNINDKAGQQRRQGAGAAIVVRDSGGGTAVEATGSGAAAIDTTTTSVVAATEVAAQGARDQSRTRPGPVAGGPRTSRLKDNEHPSGDVALPPAGTKAEESWDKACPVVSLSIWANGKRPAALVALPHQRLTERQKHYTPETGTGCFRAALSGVQHPLRRLSCHRLPRSLKQASEPVATGVKTAPRSPAGDRGTVFGRKLAQKYGNHISTP